jgi:hypothetical protein
MAVTKGQPPAQDWQCQHKFISSPERRLTASTKVGSLRLMSVTFIADSGVLFFILKYLAQRKSHLLDLSQKST